MEKQTSSRGYQYNAGVILSSAPQLCVIAVQIVVPQCHFPSPKPPQLVVENRYHVAELIGAELNLTELVHYTLGRIIEQKIRIGRGLNDNATICDL